jgi:hypothetical protein
MKVVDAFTLSAEHRELLRPDEELLDVQSRTHRLPATFMKSRAGQRRSRLSSLCISLSRS